MFIKLCKSENNYIIGYKSFQKSTSLLIYEDHCMLYDVNITFNWWYYMNTWHLLESLIKDGILKSITYNEKVTLISTIKKKLLIK